MTELVHDLSISTDYLARLIMKTRGVQAKEAVSDSDSGSNPTDDQMRDVLQDRPDDLSREEVREEIQGLDARQQAELVALMWIGRGDAEPAEWEATVQLAQDVKEQPTPRYLLGHPLVAEFWAEGAERLGIELPMGEGFEAKRNQE